MITAEQLKFREGKMTASKAPAALGISPWGTKKECFHEILGHVTPEDLGELGEIANLMEPVVIEIFNRRTGKRAEAFKETLIHPKYPWRICHLDAMSEKNTIMEIKCVGPHMIFDWGEDGDPKGVPIYVTAQVTEQAIVADVEDVDVVALLGGNDMRVYPLKITKEAKEEVDNGLLDFWNNHIIPQKPPEPTAKDIDFLKTLYKKITNEKMMYVDSMGTAAKFDDYRLVKVQITELEKKADLYKAIIQESMGDCTILKRGDDEEFTWKWTKDGVKIDWKSISESYEGALIEQGLTSGYMKRIKDNYTTIKKGHRVFLDKSKDYK